MLGANPYSQNLRLAHWILVEKASGWHYDLIFIVMNFVILFSDGGRWVLWR
jgi:hypothetical protein